MENTRNVEANTAAAQGCCAPAAKSGWLSSRNLLIGVAVAGGGGALFFGWDWLVAAGLASIIIGVLPCLVMCGLGMCAMGKKDAGTGAQAIPPKATQPPAAETVANAQPAAVEKIHSA